MITLNASGSSVTFEFSGNSTYLNDGQITVPVNSLALIIDESDMATFRKAASNDIFVSANIAEFGMTKDELMAWYKANMVGSTGGGGGVTSGEVQTMIDESISGKADSSDVYTTGQTSGATEIANALSNKADTTAVTAAIDEAVSGKVDTEDLNISGKTLYVGDYHSGGGMPYELAKEYPISTKPTKLLVKRTDDGDATNVDAFQLYFSNGTTSGSCILRVSSAVGSGITEAAWQVETPEASLELVTGEVYITFLNGYYLTMFKPATYIQGFVMQIVTDIESGSTPSVVESEIYNALDKMSETLTDVITKSDAAYYRGIGYPSLSYSSSGITFSSSAVGVGVGINTATTSTLATDASIGADNGVLGVYTTGATHTVAKNNSFYGDRIYFNSIPSNIKMYWNSSYTGSTSHYISVDCIVNDDTNGFCRWDWKNDQYVPNANYVNTAVTLSYDSTTQVVTITPSSSSALTSINYVRCNRYIAPASALTQDDSRIGLVTIDTNSYKLQEALDNKQDTLIAGENITISGNVISAQGGGGTDAPISAGTGTNSVKENNVDNVASGEYSHAEGRSTSASGKSSHAEGGFTSAKGNYSHAEGNHTLANATYSHAEGWYSQANGSISHAEGQETIANNPAEHASGMYNVSNTGESTSAQTLFSVGNGTSNARHNAFEIRQNGDIYITSGGTDIKLQEALDNKVDTSDVTTAVTSGSTDVVTSGGVYAKMGGMTIVKITESEYQSLSVKDENVLYIVIPDPNP